MFPKTLLLLLLLLMMMMMMCACFSSAKKNNRTMLVRTFVLFDKSVTDEPIDLDYLDSVDGFHSFNGSGRVWVRNVSHTSRLNISKEAELFLTSPLSTVIIPSFYALVCVVSMPINVCAIVAFALRIRPKKPAVIYMLNLAFADLLFALLLPFKITYHFLGNHWVFGPTMCRVVTAAFYWNMYCSVLLISCISVDRLLAVVYPINSLMWRTPQNAILACVGMWALSLAGSVPLVVSSQTVHVTTRQLDITTCHDVQPEAVIWQYKLYFVTVCLTLFFLPLLVTVVSYARVIWTLSAATLKAPGSSRRRTRAVVMALTVLVMFVLCFTPTNCLLLAHYLQLDGHAEKTPDGSYAAYLVFTCLGSLNCLLDPLVYYFGSSQCQRQLSRVLRCKKVMWGSSVGHSSSDSCRSSSGKMLKSSHTENSNISESLAKMDTFQENLSSQYKKLLL